MHQEAGGAASFKHRAVAGVLRKQRALGLAAGPLADSGAKRVRKETDFHLRQYRIPALDITPLNCHDHQMRNMFFGLLLLASVTAAPAPGQTPKTVWDGAYTEAQAGRGGMVFGASCAGCHALAAEGRNPLTGDRFWKSFAQKSVGELLTYVSTYMPNGQPATLSESTYNDVVAFLLKSNGFPAGATEVAHVSSADIQIIQKDGNAELPADALVRVVGCLAKNGSEWVINNSTAPERAERSGDADATRPLGKGTMQLKFVISRLDPMIGARVAVSGLLIGDGGVDGINVTNVKNVAPKCP